MEAGRQRVIDRKFASERERMADELARDIIAKIAAHAENGGQEITTSTELSALGIHSLELTEIIFDLEEAYGIEIEMNTVDAWSNLKNVGDIVEAVRALIAKKA
jgi:nodulation protein F